MIIRNTKFRQCTKDEVLAAVKTVFDAREMRFYESNEAGVYQFERLESDSLFAVGSGTIFIDEQDQQTRLRIGMQILLTLPGVLLAVLSVILSLLVVPIYLFCLIRELASSSIITELDRLLQEIENEAPRSQA